MGPTDSHFVLLGCLALWWGAVSSIRYLQKRMGWDVLPWRVNAWIGLLGSWVIVAHMKTSPFHQAKWGQAWPWVSVADVAGMLVLLILVWGVRTDMVRKRADRAGKPGGDTEGG